MAPKTSEQFEEIRRKSRQNIEQAALELFAHKGFHNTSISQISKAAKVSKGLLYNYYDSKEDLLHAIIDRAMDQDGAEIEAFLKSDLPPYQKIVAVTEGAIQMVQADPHHWKLITSLSLQEDIMTQLKDLIKAKKDEMIGIVIEVFQQMGFTEPEKEAYLYGGLLDGIMLHYITLGEDYPIMEMKDYILKKYQVQ